MKTIHERVKAIYSDYTFTKFATALRTDVKGWMPELVDVFNYWRKFPQHIPLRWTSPAGFTVIQANLKSKIKRIDHNLKGLVDDNDKITRLRLSYQIIINELDKAKIRNSIAANLIHSIDASILVMAIDRLTNRGINILAVHDSFGVHPNDIPILIEVLQEVYQYHADILTSMNVNNLPINPYQDRKPIKVNGLLVRW